MKVSIIIINYNYQRYVAQAIESALAQDYSPVEVVVVDDGSTDDSLRIIEQYSDSIKLVKQSNMGLAEATNAGFLASSGDLVIFLDADDYLYSHAISTAMSVWSNGISKVHFRLQRVNGKGDHVGTSPSKKHKLMSGDLRQYILDHGAYVTPPSSGNLFSRETLLRLFPVPVTSGLSGVRHYYENVPTDAYLKLRVPFFGPIACVQDCLGVYRIHGANFGASKSPIRYRKKRQRVLRAAISNQKFLEDFANRLGLEWNVSRIFRNSDLMILRLLSYKLDKDYHLWGEDSYRSLLGLYIRSVPNNLRYSRYSSSREVVHLGIFCMLLVVPSRMLRWYFLRSE